MARKMLIDATHAEETRVVVVDGTRIEDFDFETASRRQLAGNIYLAKVMRVEPSLQAAFVDYGGNRHGFLAFSEIHPDYYQISAEEREALLQSQERAERARRREEEQQEEERTSTRHKRGRGGSRRAVRRGPRSSSFSKGPRRKRTPGGELIEREFRIQGGVRVRLINSNDQLDPKLLEQEFLLSDNTPVSLQKYVQHEPQDPPVSVEAEEFVDTSSDEGETPDEDGPATTIAANMDVTETISSDEDIDDLPEAVGGDDTVEEVRNVRHRPRYKIQDVIKRRQIMLIQVVKEERGTKGAAVTTYLSLAGRYCVLMPNSGKGGGISRKITNAPDRKRLKKIAGDLEVPKGMGLIIRTAGAQQSDADIRRDYEYLLRQWNSVRNMTLDSYAPKLIYEEGSLIMRSIRDLYSENLSEVLVEGKEGFEEAQSFMGMIMPDQLGSVVHYKDRAPLFAKHQVENQLAGMFNPTVQLKSGGYIVIGVTEALVAIDVNSGRSTRESSVEDTATKTNLEAADEIARQLKLRDLAGLIVIDFIDMDDRRNNNAVERRIKDKLSGDRARIQVGRISSFGLLEMSRQRLRPGMVEVTTQPCAHCHGTGIVRSDDALALTILREVEEECLKKSVALLTVTAPVPVANFMLNRKRDRLAQIEQRYNVRLVVEGDPAKISPDFDIKRFKMDEAPEDLRPTQGAIGHDQALPDDAESDGEVTDAPEAKETRSERGSSERKTRGKRGGRGKGRSKHDPMPVMDLDGDADQAGPFAYGEDKESGERSGGARRSRRGGKGRKRKTNTIPRELGESAAYAMLSGRDALDRALPELFFEAGDNAGSEEVSGNGSEGNTAEIVDLTEILSQETEASIAAEELAVEDEIDLFGGVDNSEPATGVEETLVEGEQSDAIIETITEENPVSLETTVYETDADADVNSDASFGSMSFEPESELTSDPEPDPDTPPKPKKTGWWSL